MAPLRSHGCIVAGLGLPVATVVAASLSSSRLKQKDVSSSLPGALASFGRVLALREMFLTAAVAVEVAPAACFLGCCCCCCCCLVCLPFLPFCGEDRAEIASLPPRRRPPLVEGAPLGAISRAAGRLVGAWAREAAKKQPRQAVKKAAGERPRRRHVALVRSVFLFRFLPHATYHTQQQHTSSLSIPIGLAKEISRSLPQHQAPF